MPDVLDGRLGPYRRRGLLLDSNLLLLYVIGQTDRRLVRSFKRTQAFSDADFQLVFNLTLYFGGLVTTPHVLTEVNGLTNALKSIYKPPVRARLALEVPRWDERHVPAGVLAGTAAFASLGLTDAALAHLASDGGPLVMSTDGALVRLIHDAGDGAEDFAVYQHLLAQR